MDDPVAQLDVAEAASRILHDMRGLVDWAHWAHRARTDPQFVAEMRLCRSWGIPHSQFLSWDRLDREKALGFEAFEGQRCPDCGTHPSDWPEETDDPPLRVEASRCFACMAIGDWMDTYQDAHTVGDRLDRKAMRGVRTRLIRNDEPTDG